MARMKDDLRTLLYALADRLAAGLDATNKSAEPAAVTLTEERRMLTHALTAMADGDVSLAVATAAHAAGTPDGESLGEALRRVRELVTAACREAVATEDRRHRRCTRSRRAGGRRDFASTARDRPRTRAAPAIDPAVG